MSLLGDRLGSLPPATQDALAIAAALAHPTLELLAPLVDGPVEPTLKPALDAHLVDVDAGRIRFTHPLRAVAARSRASPARRREIHARLAPLVADPEERARHLALAADGPDEAAAAALDDAAQRAVARGAPMLPASSPRSLAGSRLQIVSMTSAVGAWPRPSTRGSPATRSERARSSRACSPPGPPAVTAARRSIVLSATFTSCSTCASALAVAREALAEAGNDDRLRMRC